MEEVHVTAYGILLPWSPNQQQDYARQKYALITSNWMSWDENGDVVQPYKILVGQGDSDTESENLVNFQHST